MSDPKDHAASESEYMDPELAAQSDAALVVAVGRYDEGALRELYRRHGDAVYGLANRVICDRHIAEEILQDTFVRLWNSPEKFDSERGTLRTYLLRMTHSRSVDRIRSEQARRDRQKNQDSSGTFDSAYHLAPSEPVAIDRPSISQGRTTMATRTESLL